MDAEALARRLVPSQSSIGFEDAQAILRNFYLKGLSGTLCFEFIRGELRYIDPTTRITPQSLAANQNV